ncbi:MAG TPA: M23 family metallopeptidase [Alphaproteobacteria bacterium]|nr:M23 family metallopeptidase [Alphaproteobacteria bacterium]
MFRATGKGLRAFWQELNEARPYNIANEYIVAPQSYGPPAAATPLYQPRAYYDYQPSQVTSGSLAPAAVYAPAPVPQKYSALQRVASPPPAPSIVPEPVVSSVRKTVKVSTVFAGSAVAGVTAASLVAAAPAVAALAVAGAGTAALIVQATKPRTKPVLQPSSFDAAAKKTTINPISALQRVRADAGEHVNNWWKNAVTWKHKTAAAAGLAMGATLFHGAEGLANTMPSSGPLFTPPAAQRVIDVPPAKLQISLTDPNPSIFVEKPPVVEPKDVTFPRIQYNLTSDGYSSPFAPGTHYRINDGYGWRLLRGRPEFHAGVDLDAVGGTPVHEVHGGTVIRATTTPHSGGYGNVVQVATELPDGRPVTELYAHLTNYVVRTGDIVKPGQLIGNVGDTGHAFGDHLHFEVDKGNEVLHARRNASNTINPMRIGPYRVALENTSPQRAWNLG